LGGSTPTGQREAGLDYGRYVLRETCHVLRDVIGLFRSTPTPHEAGPSASLELHRVLSDPLWEGSQGRIRCSNGTIMKAAIK